MDWFSVSFSAAQILRGAGVTFSVTVGASIVAVCVGLVIGLFRVSQVLTLRWFGALWIEFFRGTSLLVQLYWWFFVLPIFGLTMSPWTVAILGVGLNGSGFGAELVRAAIKSVDRGQFEAATALNFPRLTMMRRIILPIAVRAMLPAWCNLLIELLKGTSLIFFITISELTTASKFSADATGDYLYYFGVALLGYYAMARVLITPLFRALERSWSRGFIREVPG